MKLKHTLIVALILGTLSGFAQKKSTQSVERPKIVIGMMVDQMRWDYMYRFQDRYTEGGFKRLLREGFTCENTEIDYLPTFTAPGHTCVYTGSVPAVHGIIGNSWYDRYNDRTVENVQDTTVMLVGTIRKTTGMSPRNNLSTTITDQLRIATNFHSRTVGVAIKDRAAIQPAGHAANAAFWYDGTEGKFVTSTYYMKKLPDWAIAFNNKKMVDQYYKNNWNTLYPIDTYIMSDKDDKSYEGKANGEEKPVFPRNLEQFIGKNYGAVKNTPYGNTLTFDFAKAAIEGYNLGGGQYTDFLAISFSSPDAIGHTYGPTSIEQEDNYLRLDRELSEFFNYLDKRFGKGNYLYFITADHAGAESPGFYLENKMPSGALSEKDYGQAVTNALKTTFGIEKPILAFSNYQIYINWEAFDKLNVKKEEITKVISSVVNKTDGIAFVVESSNVAAAPIPEKIKQRIINGYNIKRSGDYEIVLQPTWKNGSIVGATHGTWYGYDSHIPLVWMGWKIPQGGHTNRSIGMTAISPTIAALLKIQAPSGSVGEVIREITGSR